MSLNFDYSRCIDRELWTDRDYDVLDTFIWGTICVDLGTITEENIPEWLFRMKMYDAVLGPFFSKKYQNEDRFPLGVSHLRKFIGLRCNVADMKRKQWLKKFWERAAAQVMERVEYEMQKDTVPAANAIRS